MACGAYHSLVVLGEPKHLKKVKEYFFHVNDGRKRLLRDLQGNSRASGM